MNKRLLKIGLPIAALIILSIPLIFVLIPKTPSVPNVVGQKFDKAAQYFSEADIKINMKEEYSFTVPKGDIISQSISPDTKIKKGETVTVVVSLGVEQVIVPDLSGKTLDEASSILSDVGLTLTSKIKFTDKIADGSVISQNITPNQMVNKGSELSVTVSAGPANVYGNTAANINNEGPASHQGNWIYYSCSDNGNYYLYKIRKDGTGNVKISSEGKFIQYINVVNEWVYYHIYGEGIYKVQIDGTKRTRVSRVQTSGMIVVGDFIYYTTVTSGTIGGRIYRMNTDGTNILKITNDTSAYVNVVDDWIYYRNGGDLYKIRTDGTQKTPVATDTGYSDINVAGNTVYFTDNFSCLKKINLNSPSQQTVVSENVWGINIAGEWIYYLSGEAKLCRMKLDGTKQTIIMNNRCAGFSIVDEWIYYFTQGNGLFYKVRTDGSDMQSTPE